MKLLFPATISALVATALATPSITTEEGIVHGGKCSDGKDAVYYKGIPFAEPPVGKLRFEPPKAWSKKYPGGGLNATTRAPACIQFGDEMIPDNKKSEDCLYLDVWAPSKATKDSKLPVKVWVYGGSNTAGGIDYPLFDGCSTADDGAILVSINYRLGPLGFLTLKSAGIHGNQAIQDILTGLEWVQKSISAFGGDPKKVVLFGQSAGATDVFTVATLPEAPRLMNGAIAESIALPTLVETPIAQKLGASYAKVLDCGVKDKSCLQSKSVADLQKSVDSDSYMDQALGAISGINVPNRKTPRFWPHVDGKVIEKNPVTNGVQVPTIIGSNQLEGMMDTLTKYNSEDVIAKLTADDYKTFLEGNFGPATETIQQYYPLSKFTEVVGGQKSLGVLAAIATVLTDAHFKCPGYESAVHSARKNKHVYMYEFTHNNTCAWLDTMPPKALPIFGAAHTAELPYVFGNLYFDFPANHTTCNSTQAEYALGKKMMSLWTAMAEHGKPSTDQVSWPEFKITPHGAKTPGMVFDNSTTPSSIDYHACELWAKVTEMLDSSNGTASSTSSSSRASGTSGSGGSGSSGTSTPTSTNGAGTISLLADNTMVLGMLASVSATFAFLGLMY